MANTEEKKHNFDKNFDDKLIKCAMEKTLEIKGVSKLDGGITESLSKNLFGIDIATKGVKLSHGDEGLQFDIYIIVEYMAKIPQLAWDIQGKIKESIEQMTTEKVLEVNIHVQGVNLPGEE